MDERSLLTAIHDGTDRWKILVRVFRKWNVYPKTSPNELFAISMVLIDEQGTKIQASALNKALHKKFRETAKEDKVYFIANFVVSKNVSQYRPTTHEYKITFTQSTHIHEEIAQLPLHSYSFIALPEIVKIKDPKEASHLIDVIAFVKSIGKLEQYRRDDDTKTKLRLVITDNEESDVECVLWDECSTDAYSSYLQNMKPPVVIILNLARIGFSEDGMAQVHNSYNATRVDFNPDIAEVKEFVASHSDGLSPVVTPLSQPIPTTFSQQPTASMLLKENRIQISAISDQRKAENFVINCEIQKLETIHGWTYEGCSKCSAKVKEEDGVLRCPQCKKKPNTIEPRLKLHYTITDHSGSASVVFWDKDAVQLVKKSAPQLKFLLAESNREYDIPAELETVVGKKVLIKLRKNDYNIKFPNSSISVIQFAMCEDLLGQFNDAASDPDDDNDAGAQKVKKKDVKSCKPKDNEDGQISPSHTESQTITLLDDDDDDEDVPIARLSHAGSTKNMKGKKKIINKRSLHAETSGKSQCSPVKSSDDKRIRKVIKKEKN